MSYRKISSLLSTPGKKLTKKEWIDLTEQVAVIMSKAPIDENSGSVEQGVYVFVDLLQTKMRVDVGDWFGNYEWFEKHVPEGLSNLNIEVEVTDEAGSPSWEHKQIFPK